MQAESARLEAKLFGRWLDETAAALGWDEYVEGRSRDDMATEILRLRCKAGELVEPEKTFCGEKTLCGGAVTDGEGFPGTCDVCWWEDGHSTKPVGWWTRLLPYRARYGDHVDIYLWNPATQITPAHCLECGTALSMTEDGQPVTQTMVPEASG